MVVKGEKVLNNGHQLLRTISQGYHITLSFYCIYRIDQNWNAQSPPATGGLKMWSFLWIAMWLDISSNIREGKKNEQEVYILGRANTGAHVSSPVHRTLISRLLIFYPINILELAQLHRRALRNLILTLCVHWERRSHSPSLLTKERSY